MAISEAPTKTRRRAISTLPIIGAILGISAILLLTPSARTARKLKGEKLLRTEYVGPKDLSALRGGVFVTRKSEKETFNASSNMPLTVFAPGPKDTIPQEFSDGMYYYPMDGQREPKSLYLLAPDPAAKEWSLFAKVWLGRMIESKKSKQTDIISSTNFSYSVVAKGKSFSATSLWISSQTFKQITANWRAFQPETRTQVESILAENRKVVGSLKGFRRYFQTEKGLVYEIGATKQYWEFEHALRDAKS